MSRKARRTCSEFGNLSGINASSLFLGKHSSPYDLPIWVGSPKFNVVITIVLLSECVVVVLPWEAFDKTVPILMTCEKIKFGRMFRKQAPSGISPGHRQESGSAGWVFSLQRTRV